MRRPEKAFAQTCAVIHVKEAGHICQIAGFHVPIKQGAIDRVRLALHAADNGGRA